MPRTALILGFCFTLALAFAAACGGQDGDSTSDEVASALFVKKPTTQPPKEHDFACGGITCDCNADGFIDTTFKCKNDRHEVACEQPDCDCYDLCQRFPGGYTPAE